MATQSVDSEIHPILGRFLQEYHAHRSNLSHHIVIYAVVIFGLSWFIYMCLEDGTHCWIDENVYEFELLAPKLAEKVNDSLRRRAEALLQSNQSVPAGPLIVSAAGIVMNKPRRAPYPRNFRIEPSWRRMKIQPGEYAWSDIADICIKKVWRDHETFHRMEILGPGRWRRARLLVAPVPRVANFSVLCDVRAALGHPPRFQS